MKWDSYVLNPLAKLRNFAVNLRRHGLKEAIGLYGYRIREKLRDRRLGIRTTGFVTANALGHGPDCLDYEAISYGCLDIVFNHLKPISGGVFLDYGCGKGRAVVLAATHAFQRVIGVELSEELSDLARQNIQRAQPALKCSDSEIVTIDATEYEVPDDVTSILLFNPFTGNVLSGVQQRIRESLQRAPRRLQIAYMHPEKEPNGFHNCDWLEKRCNLSTADWDEVKFMIYQSRCAPDRQADATMGTAVDAG